MNAESPFQSVITSAEEFERWNVWAEEQHEAADEQRRPHAEKILAAVRRIPPEVLRTVSGALEVGGGSLAGFGRVLEEVADELEDVEPRARFDPVRRIAGQLATLEDDPDIIDRLSGATGPPWKELRRALVALRRNPPPRVWCPGVAIGTRRGNPER